jgi:carbon monoxide dehydrogenase subunit G
VLIEQKFAVRAPVQKVWDFLLDVPGMSLCVPGAAQVEALDNGSYRGTLTAKLGPISASFSGKMTITEMNPPYYLASRGEGTDKRTASRATTRMTMRLQEIDQSQTEVTVSAEVSMAGRLGRFGHGIMQEQARLLTEEFAACARARLETDQQDQAEPNEAATAGELNVLTLLWRAVRAWIQRLWTGSTRHQ